jgi:hypothetical protein
MAEKRWDLRDLQGEYGAWRERNFPGSTDPLAHVAALAEEVGEMMREAVVASGEAPLPPRLAGEMSDVTICVVGACASMGLDAQELLESALHGYVIDDVLATSATVAVGKFARAVLKTSQGIRGTPEQHRRDARDALTALLRQVHLAFMSHGESMLDHVQKDWARVSARDWRRNPQTGAVPA